VHRARAAHDTLVELEEPVEQTGTSKVDQNPESVKYGGISSPKRR
jgi:hypothetical protein